jgi:hypothetical protein
MPEKARPKMRCRAHMNEVVDGAWRLGTFGPRPSFHGHTQMAAMQRPTPNSSLTAARRPSRV